MKALLLSLFLVLSLFSAQAAPNPVPPGQIDGCQYINSIATLTDGALSALQCDTNRNLKVIISTGANTIGNVGINAGTNSIGNVGVLAYPLNSTPKTGNATGTTSAVVGTLAGTSGKTTYICGFNVSAIGGTAAIGPITIAGLTGSSMVYQLASSASGVTFGQTFSPNCIPASAANTSITITTTADGTATAVDVNSWGYQL